MNHSSYIHQCNRQGSKLEPTHDEVTSLWEKLNALSLFDYASDLMASYTTGSLDRYQFNTYRDLMHLPRKFGASSQNEQSTEGEFNSDTHCYICKRLKPSVEISNNFSFVDLALTDIKDNELKATVFECSIEELKQLVVSKLIHEDLVVDMKNFLVVS